MKMLRGDVYYADLTPVRGCEQGGVRPVLIIQNDVGNRYSTTVIVAAITGQLTKNQIPTHIVIDGDVCGLRKDSVVLLEQVRTIDRCRLKEYIGHLGADTMAMVDEGIAISFGIPSIGQQEEPEFRYEMT